MRRRLASLCALLALSLTTLPAMAEGPVYRTSFDDAAGWPDSDRSGDLTAVYTAVNGEYLISPLRSGVYGLARAPVGAGSADMAVEADVRLSASQSGSRAGLACRVGTGQDFVAFALVGNGSYEIVRVRAGRGTVLGSGALGFDASQGARLRAECRGTRLSLAANGRTLGEAIDTDPGSDDGAGLLSVAPVTASTNATFDNFVLSALGAASSVTGRVTTRAPQRVEAPADVPTAIDAGALPQIDDLALYEDDGNGKPGERRSLFTSGQQRVYLVMELAEPVRTTYEARWIAVRGVDERVVKQSSFSANGLDRRVWLYLDRHWTPGLYRVELYVGATRLDEREFSVE